MFCEGTITDNGLGFLNHVAVHPGCGSQYEAWKERLGEDWGGGD